MAYNSIVKCYSDKSISSDYKDFCLYADGISYLNPGRYIEVEQEFKQKHALYAIIKGNSAESVGTFLTDMLLNGSPGRSKEEIIEFLRNTVTTALQILGESNYSGYSMALIYTENDVVYGAGFGDMRIYRYSKEKSTIKKFYIPETYMKYANSVSIRTDIDFSKVEENRDKAVDVLCLGTVKENDRFLLSVSPAVDEIEGDELIRFFSDDDDKIRSAYEMIKTIEPQEQLITASVFFKRKSSKVLRNIVLIFIVLALVLACGFIWMNNSKNVSYENDIDNNTVVEQILDSDADKPEEKPKEESEDEQVKIYELTNLKPELEKIAGTITGSSSNVAYYIKNLETGEELCVRDSKMYSASLIKLYIMAEIYRQIDEGTLEFTSHIKNLLNKMITISDNDACNELAKIAGGGDMQKGFELITQNAVNLGCQYTVQKNDLQAVRTIPIEPGNFTSVKDCGIILEKIYNGDLVSPEYSAEMLTLLKNQQRRFKIPKYLPNSATIANKTGETSTAQNDVAIIYTDKCDYILCVMISDFANSGDEAMDVVARISEAVFNYMMSDEVIGKELNNNLD